MNQAQRNINWQDWIERYDKMQEKYLVKRSERFDIITRLIKTVCPNPKLIVELGCGTGSLTIRLLEEFDSAKVYAFDSDPSILLLAKKRLERFKDRVQIVQADITKMDWDEYNGADAAVSTTALHWLKIENLEAVYRQVYKSLHTGGIFLNADHSASLNNLIQKSWELNSEQMLEQSQSADDWGGFWQQYLSELGDEVKIERQKAIGQWEGCEEGMPLKWHFEKLQQCGFKYVDCFWRCNNDAIYGAIKE
jgi:ubiquinone/menaquinone biosynthesis C-methylase UbiE